MLKWLFFYCEVDNKIFKCRAFTAGSWMAGQMAGLLFGSPWISSSLVIKVLQLLSSPTYMCLHWFISVPQRAICWLRPKKQQWQKYMGIAIHNSQKWPLPLQPRFVLAFVIAGSAVHSKWHSVSLGTREKIIIKALVLTSKSKTVGEPLLNLIWIQMQLYMCWMHMFFHIKM